MYVCGIYYNTTYITINLFLQERTGFIYGNVSQHEECEKGDQVFR